MEQPPRLQRSSSMPHGHAPLTRLCSLRRSTSLGEMPAELLDADTLRSTQSSSSVENGELLTASQLLACVERRPIPIAPPLPEHLRFRPTTAPLRITQRGSALLNEPSRLSITFTDDDLGYPETCDICYEDLPESEVIVRTCCSARGHGGGLGHFCKTCMTQYVRAQLSDGVVRMRCPTPHCSAVMKPEEVRPYVAESQQDFFNRLLIIKSDNPNVRLCPRCSKITSAPAMLRRNRRRGTKLECEDCHFVWCFECESPWHNDMTCARARKGGKLFRQWLKHRNPRGDTPNGQRCPKCKIPIQRSSGCNQMTCSRCHTRFCYRCGQRMRDFGILGDHYDRYSIAGCPYNLRPEHGVQRRAIRGAALTAGVTIGVPLAVGAGAIVVTAVVAASPFYGTYKLGKKIVKRF